MERQSPSRHPEVPAALNALTGKEYTPHWHGTRMYLSLVFMLLALGGQGTWKWYFTSDKSFT